MKELTPAPGAPTADFAFGVANNSEFSVVIDHVQTSCGCTVAQLPSQPWTLTPHTNGTIKVSVNLAGKSGTFFKGITVYSTNAQKQLTVKVNLPMSPSMLRSRNRQMAMNDQQAVFRGDCAKCHVEPATGLMGNELYAKACGICHDAAMRASMVPNLRALTHPTDYAFWKQAIADGRPRTMMPAFAQAHGGPLTNEQIDSLAKFLTETAPSHAAIVAPGMAPISATNSTPMPH